jgi:hypothetical protein
MSVDEHEQERWHVQNLISKPVLVCETATDKQIPPSITLLPASSCSRPYATIPFFNTAKTTVPRLQQSDPASGSCSQWWMASTNISCLALHPADALIHGPLSFTSNYSTYTSKLSTLCTFHVFFRIHNSTIRRNSMPLF